jgi:hypothetical protein
VKSVAAIIFALLCIALVGAALWLWTPDRSRAALEAKYLTQPGEMLEVAGVRLRVRDTGQKEAPALIMLHGFGSSLETWEPWARALQTDYRVVRFATCPAPAFRRLVRPATIPMPIASRCLPRSWTDWAWIGQA